MSLMTTSTRRKTPRVLRLAAVVAAAVLGFFLALAPAATASAHTPHLSGTAECQDDGTYTVTWTYSVDQVPGNAEAESRVIKHVTDTGTPGVIASDSGADKGGQWFFSVWTEHQVNNPGVPTLTGNWSRTFTQSGIPGNATTATVQMQTDWNDGASDNDPTETVPLPDDCTQPPVTPEKPEPTVTSSSQESADCTSDTITTVTTTVTTDWVLVDNVWVPAEPVTTTSTATRPATDTECPPVIVPDEPAPIVRTSVVDTVRCDSVTVTTTTITETITWSLVNNVWVQNPPTATSVDVTRPATPQECPPQPSPIVKVSSVDDLDCDTTTVKTTTTTETITWSLVDNVWQQNEPTYSTVVTSRDATAEECPPVVTPPTNPPVTETPPTPQETVPAPVVVPPTTNAEARTFTAPVLTTQLASTGTNGLGTLGWVLIVLGVIGLGVILYWWFALRNKGTKPTE